MRIVQCTQTDTLLKEICMAPTFWCFFFAPPICFLSQIGLAAKLPVQVGKNAEFFISALVVVGVSLDIKKVKNESLMHLYVR